MLLRAKPLAQKLEKTIQQNAAVFFQKTKTPAHLVVILIGSHPASVLYTQKKVKKAQSLGLKSTLVQLQTDIKPKALQQMVQSFNKDPLVHGILIQRPLPIQLSENEVICWIDPQKDVDGFHPLQKGKLLTRLDALIPCTAKAVMELFDFYNISLESKVCVIIGRSQLVGMPLAILLNQRNATIIHCHSYTKNLISYTQQADILVVAAGKKHLIQLEHVHKKMIIIDIGIHQNNESICGDVNFQAVKDVCAAITPVPGGIGPLTVLMLLMNTLKAAAQQNAIEF